jgi:hypothetical protein
LKAETYAVENTVSAVSLMALLAFAAIKFLSDFTAELHFLLRVKLTEELFGVQRESEVRLMI